MLGVTGILVGTVFLTSIFFQTVLGLSALRAGLAFLPFAIAITAGRQQSCWLAPHLATSPQQASPSPPPEPPCLSTASGTAQFATNLLPGLLVLGLGVGMVFVAVSVTAMAGIPPQHAGMAS